MTDGAWLQIRPGELIVRLHVQPRSRKPGLVGLSAGRLKVRVSEPATEGRANQAVVRMVAELARVPKSSVVLGSGASSREKTLRVSARDPEEAAERLRAALASVERRRAEIDKA